MRFKTFLSEQPSVNELIAQEIFNRCKPFLRQVKFDAQDAAERLSDGPINSTRTCLWRGFEEGISFQEFKERQTSRNPTSTSKEIHNEIDSALEELTGTFYRSKSAFATGKYADANGYGRQVYLMFPIGDFKFCWSPEISDAYNFFDNGRHQNAEIFHRPDFNCDVDESSPRYLDAIHEYIVSGKAGYVDVDLRNAVRSHNEIMIVGDYYLLKPNASAVKIMTFLGKLL